MSGRFHDIGGDGGDLGLTALDFHPALDAFALAEIAQLAKGGGDVADSGFRGNIFRKAVRADLHAPRAGIVREVNPLFADFYLLAALGGVGGLEFAGGAEAQQAGLGAVEAGLDALAGGGGERWLDSVLVAGA